MTQRIKTLPRALKELRALLDRRGGWGQGQSFEPLTLSFCLTGGVDYLTRREETDYDLYGKHPKDFGVKPVDPDLKEAMEGALYECLPEKWRTTYGFERPDIQDFNDARSRRKKDVLEVIDCAIADARAKAKAARKKVS